MIYRQNIQTIFYIVTILFCWTSFAYFKNAAVCNNFLITLSITHVSPVYPVMHTDEYCFLKENN